MTYMSFQTTDKQIYFFVGKNKQAIMLDTNQGTEFGGAIFLANSQQELTSKEFFTKNLPHQHLAVKAILSGSPSYLVNILKAT